MEKTIYTIRESDLTYGRGYVYSLQYHIVWCTKYRKQVLKNGLQILCIFSGRLFCVAHMIRPFFVFLSAVKLYTDLWLLARVFLEKFSEKQTFRRNLSPCGRSFPRKLRKHTVYNRYYFLYNKENA